MCFQPLSYKHPLSHAHNSISQSSIPQRQQSNAVFLIARSSFLFINHVFMLTSSLRPHYLKHLHSIGTIPNAGSSTITRLIQQRLPIIYRYLSDSTSKIVYQSHRLTDVHNTYQYLDTARKQVTNQRRKSKPGAHPRNRSILLWAI